MHPNRTTLNLLSVGACGIVQGITLTSGHNSDLERRLLEMGFQEGVHVEVLHHGFPARDPIAVRMDGFTVALRRREAEAVMIEPA